MRIFVPSPVPLTAREKIGRDVRLVCRCASMALAGVGIVCIAAAAGIALGIWGSEVTVAMARHF